MEIKSSMYIIKTDKDMCNKIYTYVQLDSKP